MYIHPFVAGVLTALAAELAAIVVAAVVLYVKSNKKN